MGDQSKIPGIFFLALAAVVVSPFIGYSSSEASLFTSLAEGISLEDFFERRLPRTAIIFFSGAALGLAGLSFQFVFRESFIGPSTAGALGVGSFAIKLASILSVYSVARYLGATLAVGLAAFLLYFLSSRISRPRVLLSGYALLFVFTALSMLLDLNQGIGLSSSLASVLGDAKEVELMPLTVLVLVVVISISLFSLFLDELDLIILGEDLAASRGVEVESFRVRALLVGIVLAGVAVSSIGPVALIGVVAGCLVKKLFNNSFREMLPAAFFIGGTLLLVCDCLSRAVLERFDLPLGAVTVLLLSPAFIWLLQKERRAILPW